MADPGKRKSVPPARFGSFANPNQLDASSNIDALSELDNGSDFRPSTGGNTYIRLQDYSDNRSDPHFSDDSEMTDIFASETDNNIQPPLSPEMIVDDLDHESEDDESDDPDWNCSESDLEEFDTDESESDEYIYANSESEEEFSDEDLNATTDDSKIVFSEDLDYEFEWGDPLDDNPEEYQRIENLLKKFPLTEPAGYIGSKDIKTISDAYSLMVDDKIMELICTETNRYAQQEKRRHQQIAKQKKKKPSKRIRNWRPLTKSELKVYLGIRIMMGCNSKNSISAYWEIDEDDVAAFGERMRKYMSFYRFENISRFLHFCDNEKQPEKDRIFKIRNLADQMNHNFSAYFKPNQKLCIDESQLQWRGRFCATTYNPNKAHPYGQKIFKLCFGNGVTLKFLIYSGKDDDQKFTPFNIVCWLMSEYLDKGYILCVDNYYTSLPLAVYLLERNTHLLGTMRKNRKHLPEELKHKVRPGQVISFFEENKRILVCRSRDYSATKKDYLLLSTTHTHERVPMLDKDGVQKIYRTKDKRSKEVTRVAMTETNARKDYNVQKDPVDTSDSKTANSSPHIKHYKWYQRTFDELVLNTSVVNAYEILRFVKENDFNEKKRTVPEERKVLYKYLMNSGLAEMKDIVLEDKLELFPDPASLSVVHHFTTKEAILFHRCVPCKAASKKHRKDVRTRNVSKGATKCVECDVWMCHSCFLISKNHITTISDLDMEVDSLSFLNEPGIPSKEENIIPLTKEMETVISKNLKSRSSKPIVKSLFTNIYPRDLNTLTGKTWLNDAVIDYYFYLISKRPKVHVFPKYVFDFKESGKDGMEFAKDFDWNSCDILFFPILYSAHWRLVAVNIPSKLIEYYDSFYSDYDDGVKLIADFLEDVYFMKFGEDLNIKSNWEVRYKTRKMLPKQSNQYDCGVFICKYAEYISRKASITFTQEHIPHFRKSMIYEIVSSSLLTDLDDSENTEN